MPQLRSIPLMHIQSMNIGIIFHTYSTAHLNPHSQLMLYVMWRQIHAPRAKSSYWSSFPKDFLFNASLRFLLSFLLCDGLAVARQYAHSCQSHLHFRVINNHQGKKMVALLAQGRFHTFPPVMLFRPSAPRREHSHSVSEQSEGF